jgi:hypothetical protein
MQHNRAGQHSVSQCKQHKSQGQHLCSPSIYAAPEALIRVHSTTCPHHMESLCPPPHPDYHPHLFLLVFLT